MMLKGEAKAFECRYGVSLAKSKISEKKVKEKWGRQLPNLYGIPHIKGGSRLKEVKRFKMKG